MIGDDALGGEHPPKPLDDMIVRNAAEEMLEAARKVRRIEVCLVVLAAVLMVTIAGFTGWNTYRLRSVNRNLTVLVRTLEANQVAQQTYNEGHATSSGENFQALIDNIKCFTDFFVTFNQAVAAGTPPPDKVVLDACFKPTAPSPSPMPLPSEKRDGKR